MAIDINKSFVTLVKMAFDTKDENDLMKVKQFFLENYADRIDVLKKRLTEKGTQFYDKEVLVASEEVEIIISGWSPGNRCYPHDHDKAECYVFVLSGEVTNTLLEFEDNTLSVKSQESAIADECLYLNDSTIHYMENVGQEDLICLHIYQPGISEMRVFDEENQQIYVLNDKAGAWLPPESNDYILNKVSYADAAEQIVT